MNHNARGRAKYTYVKTWGHGRSHREVGSAVVPRQGLRVQLGLRKREGDGPLRMEM